MHLKGTREPVPTAPIPGYDGRLFDWLVMMLNYGPPDGPERAWPIIVKLVARAPDDPALTFIGAGAIEDLVNNAGGAFADRIVGQAASDFRFRTALQHVWYQSDAPRALKELIDASRASGRWPQQAATTPDGNPDRAS
jgi:hypothetical protein